MGDRAAAPPTLTATSSLWRQEHTRHQRPRRMAKRKLGAITNEDVISGSRSYHRMFAEAKLLGISLKRSKC